MNRDFCCRSAAHCIEYAHLILWGQERRGEEFDADEEEHMQWVFTKALARAEEFGIQARNSSKQSTNLKPLLVCSAVRI